MCNVTPNLHAVAFLHIDLSEDDNYGRAIVLVTCELQLVLL